MHPETRDKETTHKEAVHHEGEHHEKEHWLERNWAFLVVGFGAICIYFIDTWAPTH
jgi:hypothetical protein